MVVYYSRSGSTRLCAEALAAEKGEGLFELKAKGGSMISGVFKSICGMKTRVESLPELTGESAVYICSPVWAGRFTPAVRYFVNNSDFKGKTVKLLLTCATPSDEYARACEKELARLGVAVSDSLAICPKGGEIDKNLLRGL